MVFDPDRVSTVTFDSYSTLVDVDSAREALVGYVDDPDAVASLWRHRAVTYSIVANFLDDYATYYDLHRAGLAYALDVHGVDLPAAEIDEINAVYHDLDPFDDVRDGLARLHDAGYDPSIISNGNPEMLDTLIETADIGDLVFEAVSADELEIFKPDARLYQHAAGRVGTPVDEVVHVTAAVFDAQGAIHAGMQGIWIDRKGQPPERFGPDPDRTIETIHELADVLGA